MADSHGRLIHPYFRSFDDRFVIKEAKWTGVHLGDGAFVEVHEVDSRWPFFVMFRF